MRFESQLRTKISSKVSATSRHHLYTGSVDSQRLVKTAFISKKYDSITGQTIALFYRFIFKYCNLTMVNKRSMTFLFSDSVARRQVKGAFCFQIIQLDVTDKLFVF